MSRSCDRTDFSGPTSFSFPISDLNENRFGKWRGSGQSGREFCKIGNPIVEQKPIEKHRLRCTAEVGAQFDMSKALRGERSYSTFYQVGSVRYRDYTVECRQTNKISG